MHIPNIVQLPQELWDRVIKLSDKIDLQHLRLVCKKFEAQATALALAEISVCLQPRSLQRLVMLTIAILPMMSTVV